MRTIVQNAYHMARDKTRACSNRAIGSVAKGPRRRRARVIGRTYSRTCDAVFIDEVFAGPRVRFGHTNHRTSTRMLTAWKRGRRGAANHGRVTPRGELRWTVSIYTRR